MVRYFVLGSGSCGNAYVFCDGKDSVLIDNGYSRAELRRRFEGRNLDYGSLRAVFVTHLHPDHARGVGVVARKDALPVYLGGASAGGERGFEALGVPEGQRRLMREGEEVEVGGFSVSCFGTFHDSEGSVGYLVRHGALGFVLITDTGLFDSRMVGLAKSSDVLFLEANYDPFMLRSGPYPPDLQRRIASDRGHLSNDQAEEFLRSCGLAPSEAGDGGEAAALRRPDCRIKRIYLVHLSDVNNSPSLLRRRFAWLGGMLTVCPRGEIRGGSAEED